MTTSLRPFDRAADHTAATARRLDGTVGWKRDTTVSLEDREAVVRFMTTRIEWRATSRWDIGGSSLAPWHMVQDATQGWRDFGDLLSGTSFRDILDRCLSIGGSGFAEDLAVCPEHGASAEAIVEATRQAIIESNEEGEIDEWDEAILALPPAVLVAVHLRMEARFIEAIREEPGLILHGSVESIQRDIEKVWGKVMEWLRTPEAREALCA